MLSIKDILRFKYTNKLKIEWKELNRANPNQKIAVMVILLSDMIDFKRKFVTREKDGHFIMITVYSIRKVTIINICVPNNRSLLHIQKLTQNGSNPIWKS